MSDKDRRLSFGENATKITSAQGTVVETFDYLYAIEDSVIQVKVNWTNAATTETVTLSAGQQLPGTFFSIAVTSGTVLALK